MVSLDENAKLLAPFTLQELREVVFSFQTDKAPSSDGFTALFFQSCWEFIGWDLLIALEESWKTRSMLKYFNSTNIILIPKIKEPKTFVDFFPISLCNLTYKIVSKSIYLRLQNLLPHIISHEQGGFVPGRETMEGEMVAHEVLHSININQSSNFVIKMDMHKAYDKVS